jgi:HEAT repeat protein
MSTQDGTGESSLIDRMEESVNRRLGSDGRRIDELIALALTELHAGQDSREPNEILLLAMEAADYVGDDRPSEALAVLQHRGNAEVFKAAQRLCASPDPKEREVGVTILGQNLVAGKTFPEEKFDILLGLLENETDPDVLSAACFALGHIGDPRAIGPMAKLKNHPNEDVRYSVARGLSGQADDLAMAVFIELSTDEDEDVRNWATYGLSSPLVEHIDTPEIREALAARLDDPFEEVRLEAMYGLAIRKDRRALELLREELEAGHYYNQTSIYEAAAALADPSLLPGLLRLREEGEEDEFLEEAIKACGGGPPKL